MRTPSSTWTRASCPKAPISSSVRYANAVSQAHRAQHVAAQIAHRADRARPADRRAVLRPAPDRGRRLVRRGERRRARSPRHAQRHLARLSDAAALPREGPRGAGGEAGGRRELVRRHLPGPEEVFSAVRGGCRAVLRDVPGVPLRRGREARVPARSARRSGRPQARRDLRLQGRRHAAAARHDLPRRLELHGARDLRRRRDAHRHLADVLPLGLSQRDDEAAGAAARRPGRGVRGADRRPGALGGDLAGHRRAVQELGRRDPDRDREGVPARLRRHDRGDRGGHPHRLFRGRVHHPRGNGQHHGDDRARAPFRVRDAEGARLRPRLRRRAGARRVARHCGGGRARRHRLHLPGGGLVRHPDRHAVPGPRGEPGDRRHAARSRARGRRRRRGATGAPRGARAHRRGLESHRMKSIPLAYSVRNLWTRKLTTALTAGGMALVVFVFAAVLMLDAGLRQAMVSTGQPDNVIVTRRSAGSEVQSGVERPQAALVESQSEVVAASKETVVLIAQPKRDSGTVSNVTVRGLSPQGIALRPQVRLTAGRMFRPASTEVVVGRSIAQRFAGTGVGERLRFGARDWLVVGVFDAGGSAFDSEIWGDVDQMMQSFRRQAYSSVIARLADPGGFDALKQRLESDPRLTVDVKPERLFYEEQSAALSGFISILGLTLSVIFSIGAMIGAMITMYAAVAGRTGEIGALRALGFRRRAILTAFLAEALALAALGWALGLAAASLMQFVHISTMNWQSFGELAFSFALTPKIVLQSLAFAAV